MVQSIWLNFDKRQLNENTVNTIKKIIKDKYKCYSYIDDKQTNTMHFKFLDSCQISEILKKIKLSVEDNKRCDCGCYSTDFERLVFLIDLELNFGKIDDSGIIKYSYFQLGRTVWGSVGMYKERLNTIRAILEEIKKDMDKKGIKCKLDLSDCEVEYFEGYFPLDVKNKKEERASSQP